MQEFNAFQSTDGRHYGEHVPTRARIVLDDGDVADFADMDVADIEERLADLFCAAGVLTYCEERGAFMRPEALAHERRLAAIVRDETDAYYRWLTLG